MIAISGLVTAAPATSAAAPARPTENNYIQFTNHGAYLARTCYHWIPSGVANDYCHQGRPAGQTWRAYIPAGAQSVQVSMASWQAGYEQFDNRNVTNGRNWCYTLLGTTVTSHAEGAGCPS